MEKDTLYEKMIETQKSAAMAHRAFSSAKRYNKYDEEAKREEGFVKTMTKEVEEIFERWSRPDHAAYWMKDDLEKKAKSLTRAIATKVVSIEKNWKAWERAQEEFAELENLVSVANAAKKLAWEEWMESLKAK